MDASRIIGHFHLKWFSLLFESSIHLEVVKITIVNYA